MRFETLFLTAMFASVLPVLAEAQHSHGGAGSTEPMRYRERPKAPDSGRQQPGLLPPGGPRQIEVLVIDHGFSPNEIRADVGETVTLLIRRSAAGVCASGLSVPKRQLNLQLPTDETVRVTLELAQAERIQLQCVNDDAQAVMIVGSP